MKKLLTITIIISVAGLCAWSQYLLPRVGEAAAVTSTAASFVPSDGVPHRAVTLTVVGTNRIFAQNNVTTNAFTNGVPFEDVESITLSDPNGRLLITNVVLKSDSTNDVVLIHWK